MASSGGGDLQIEISSHSMEYKCKLGLDK